MYELELKIKTSTENIEDVMRIIAGMGSTVSTSAQEPFAAQSNVPVEVVKPPVATNQRQVTPRTVNTTTAKTTDSLKNLANKIASSRPVEAPTATDEEPDYTDPFNDGSENVDIDSLIGEPEETVPSFEVSSHINVDANKNVFTYDGVVITTSAIRVETARLINAGKREAITNTVKGLGFQDFNSMINSWEKKTHGAITSVATYYDTIKQL